MGETLNMRQEKECSQHSTAQKVQIEANSQGVRNIPLEELRRMIVATEEQDDKLVVGGHLSTRKFGRHHC